MLVILKWRNHIQHMKKMDRRCFIITCSRKVKYKVPLGVGKEDMTDAALVEGIMAKQ